jgi:hypothetical protein
MVPGTQLDRFDKIFRIEMHIVVTIVAKTTKETIFAKTAAQVICTILGAEYLACPFACVEIRDV